MSALSSPPCHACRGVCCSTDAGWKFVQLTPDEAANPLFRDVLIVHPEARVQGFWFKLKGAGGGYCPFFDIVNRNCKIYEQRPQNCRHFDCRECQSQGQFFLRNHEVLSLILQYQQPT